MAAKSSTQGRPLYIRFQHPYMIVSFLLTRFDLKHTIATNNANKTAPTTTRLMPAAVFELRPRELPELGGSDLPLMGGEADLEAGARPGGGGPCPGSGAKVGGGVGVGLGGRVPVTGGDEGLGTGAGVGGFAGG